MKRVFVDTGAWYALVDADDPDHARVSDFFHEYRGRMLTTSFDEVITLSCYRLGWNVAKRLGEELRECRVSRLERITNRAKRPSSLFFPVTAINVSATRTAPASHSSGAWGSDSALRSTANCCFQRYFVTNF